MVTVTTDSPVLEPSVAMRPIELDDKSPRRSFRYRMTQVVPPVLLVLLVIGIWQALAALNILHFYVLPGPWEIADAFGHFWWVIISNTWPTTEAALIGFCLGNTIAIILAVSFIHWKLAERAIFPLAVALRSVPFIALAPVIGLQIGYGLGMKVVIVSFSTFFPTMVNMMRGLRSVDEEARELFHTYSATRRQILMKLRWPAATPFLFSALRIAAGMSFLSALVAEWIGSNRGLGFLVVTFSNEFRIQALWATVLTATFCSLAMFGIVALVERRVLRWTRAATAIADN